MEELKYSEILQLNKKLSKQSFDLDLSVKILSNVTINSFREILEYSLRCKKINPRIEIGNYDNIVQDSSISDPHNIVFIFYDVLNIIDNISTYFESLDDFELSELEQKIKSEIDLIIYNLRNTPTIIFNSFSSGSIISPFIQTTKLEKFVHNLNSYLYALSVKNLVLVDIDKIIFELGRSQVFDFRFYQSSKAPYTISFFKTYIRAIESTILKITGKSKKAIIFDCDNTLWKGILGEDGPENIQMSSTSSYGKPYYDIQCIAKYLSKNGILVGICSKNNLTDVEEIFNNHPGMVLSEKEIIIKRVNWNDKVSNLQEIAAELNIGIESLLFVDDSDYEINLVKERMPQIKTFQVPKNIFTYKNAFLNFIQENISLSFTEEDLKKTLQYKDQIIREKEKKAFDSIDDYIASLKIELTIHLDRIDFIPRVSQLTQKTNQFNLTTYRYTETEIESFMQDTLKHVFTASVSDKFGDSGLTFVCILEIDKLTESVKITSLLMSCRVIGRNIEFVIMNQIFKHLMRLGMKYVYAYYIHSPKNSQVVNFYEKNGFTVIAEQNGFKEYKLVLSEYKDPEINYMQINNLYN